jgi:hypothetical protein
VLLKPLPVEWMVGYPASTLVNRPTVVDPRCVEPAERPPDHPINAIVMFFRNLWQRSDHPRPGVVARVSGPTRSPDSG